MVYVVVLAGAKVANKTENTAGYVILFLKWLLPQTYLEVTVHNYKDTWYMSALLQIRFNVYLNSVFSLEKWTETGEKLD